MQAKGCWLKKGLNTYPSFTIDTGLLSPTRLDTISRNRMYPGENFWHKYGPRGLMVAALTAPEVFRGRKWDL